MLGLLFGNPLMALVRGPMLIMGIIGGCVALCGCIRCFRGCGACRLRNCALVKHFLLFLGHDSFDDFELMVLVHDVIFNSADKDKVTVVQISSGAHTVKTNQSSNGIFQQPLHITVEQGTEHVVVDLLTKGNQLLATVKLDVKQIHGETNSQPEVTYTMQQKSKGIHNPRIKLTMVISAEDDAEKGLLDADDGKFGQRTSLNILVRQQLQKAKQCVSEHPRKSVGEEGASEMDVLREACTGPLELFEGLGQTQKVFVAVTGPPTSKRWMLGIWRDEKDFAARRTAVQEVGLLKIQSIQADPQRNHVFVINCFDQSRVRQSLTFRRVDRNRDVWVEILHLLVMKAREKDQKQKDLRAQRTEEAVEGSDSKDKKKRGKGRALTWFSGSSADPVVKSPRPTTTRH